MDERPMRDQGHAGGNTGGGTATLDQGRAMEQAKNAANQAVEQVKTTANQAMDQAKTIARNIGDQAAAAAADPAATAQDLARKATEAGDVLHRQGQRAGEYLTQNVNEYPLTALLIAGMVGYGLAYLIHSQSQGRSSFRAER
jgi:hypothetical protein